MNKNELLKVLIETKRNCEKQTHCRVYSIRDLCEICFQDVSQSWDFFSVDKTEEKAPEIIPIQADRLKILLNVFDLMSTMVGCYECPCMPDCNSEDCCDTLLGWLKDPAFN